MIAQAVDKGAGLIMLGGRSSFGPGGWATSRLADVLPVTKMHPDDGQIEPEEGIKFVPNRGGLDNSCFQIGADRAEMHRIWNGLPPLSGINHRQSQGQCDRVRDVAGPRNEPIMVGIDAGKRAVAGLRGGDLGRGPETPMKESRLTRSSGDR